MLGKLVFFPGICPWGLCPGGVGTRYLRHLTGFSGQPWSVGQLVGHFWVESMRKRSALQGSKSVEGAMSADTDAILFEIGLVQCGVNRLFLSIPPFPPFPPIQRCPLCRLVPPRIYPCGQARLFDHSKAR